MPVSFTCSLALGSGAVKAAKGCYQEVVCESQPSSPPLPDSSN